MMMNITKTQGWRLAALALWALAALLALRLAWGLRGAGPSAAVPPVRPVIELPPFRWPALDGGAWKLSRVVSYGHELEPAAASAH